MVSTVLSVHADDDDDDDDDDYVFLLLLLHRSGRPIRSACTPIAMNSFFTY